MVQDIWSRSRGAMVSGDGSAEGRGTKEARAVDPIRAGGCRQTGVRVPSGTGAFGSRRARSECAADCGFARRVARFSAPVPLYRGAAGGTAAAGAGSFSRQEPGRVGP